MACALNFGIKAFFCKLAGYRVAAREFKDEFDLSEQILHRGLDFNSPVSGVTVFGVGDL